MRLSGLEPLNYQPDAGKMRKTFLMIGERCNVAGSSIYKKAIVDGNYDKAASIATKQVSFNPPANELNPTDHISPCLRMASPLPRSYICKPCRQQRPCF